MEQNIALLLFFGIPAILFTWFLLNKGTQFSDHKKVGKANLLFRLPFSSAITLFIFMFSSFFLVAGLATVFEGKGIEKGWFTDTASQQLNNFKKDWFMAVAFPAFETNLTLIYEQTSTRP